MNKLAAVLAGVWLGLQLGIGYVAVPLLFQHMGKMEAGAMAGSMFDFVAYTGLAVWLLLYFIGRHELGRSLMRSKTNKFVLLLLSLLAVNQFLVTPVIAGAQKRRQQLAALLAGRLFRAMARHFQRDLYAVQLVGTGLGVSFAEAGLALSVK
jgi:hypothetical protein